MIISLKKSIVLITLFVMGLLCIPLTAQQSSVATLHSVVIDAGHGGKDPGATHGRYLEKDINLRVALALGAKIESELSDVKVIYTRKTDVFIPLYERGDIANKADADLFISIHTNAASSSSANGCSTYVLGMTGTERNMREVQLENKVITLEDDYSTQYAGFDPSSPESYIIFSLMQYVNIDKSMQLAQLVQQRYVANNPAIRNRGTDQAGFVVLWKTAMPSILTEVGFISNDSDRAILYTDEGIASIVRSLFEAVSEYKLNIEKSNSQTQIVRQQCAPDSTVKAEPATQFFIQLFSSKRVLAENDSRLRNYASCAQVRKSGNWYKYYIGGYLTFADAQEALTKAREHFKDAFIVAFDGDRQVSLDEAKQKIKN